MQTVNEVFNVPFIARRGARLVNNMVIDDTEEYFEFKIKVWHQSECAYTYTFGMQNLCNSGKSIFVSVNRDLCVQIFNFGVHEKYSKTGESVQYPRRDLRKGKADGRYSVLLR